MAHVEQKIFDFGKTIRVKASVEKRRDFEVEAEKEAIKAVSEEGEEELVYPLYPHQSIVGIDSIEFNVSVGAEDPTWQGLEKGIDVGGLFREIASLKKELQSQKMHNGKLKKKLQSLGILTEAMEAGASDA